MTEPTRTTDKMTEAIRIGCSAAEIHLRCSYPECSCTSIPTAIRAAVSFAIRDAANDMKAAMVKGVKEALCHVR